MTAPMEDRIVAAAVDLFGDQGIDATSLQMIADRLGVTKGAVYYHFKTKDEIVEAVYSDALRDLEQAVAQAEEIEQAATRMLALELLIPKIVDISVARRGVFGKLRFDPAMVRMMSSDAAYAALLRRLDRLFSGDAPGPEERVRAAAVVSVLAGASVHHLVHELDDETLRAQLAVVIAQLSVAPAAQVQ